MTTIATHFDRMLRHQQAIEDEVHKLYDHNHIQGEQGRWIVTLSNEIHETRKGIERAKVLIT